MTRIPDCARLMFRPWVVNEIWIADLSSATIGMLVSSSKLFLVSKEVHFNSGVRLLLELYYVAVIKHVAYFTIWAKLTVAFTCTSIPLKVWRIDEFGEKRHGSADLQDRGFVRQPC